MIKTQNTSKASKVIAEDWDFRGADTKKLTHCFHNYPAMMIPQVAQRLVREFGPRTKHGVLMDPFCGTGTSLVEAKLAGLNAYGIDINPLARLIAKVKTTPIKPNFLQSHLNTIIRIYEDQRKQKLEIPHFFNIDYWFSKQVARELQALFEAINGIEIDEVRDFFLVPFSETIRESSYTRNSEFKLYRIPKEKLATHRPNVIGLFTKKTRRNIQGMKNFTTALKNKCWTKILDEDTRRQTSIPDASVDLVVTSPPYGDSKTTVAYGQYSRLSLQWLGHDTKESRSIDKNALGGRAIYHTHVDKQSDTLDRVIVEIMKIDDCRANEVLAFYHDFDLCLSEIERVVKIGGYVCLVVGNRTVAGQKISTDRIFVELADRHHLSHKTTFFRNIPNKRMPLRNSPSNVAGRTSPTMSTESIIILQKRS